VKRSLRGLGTKEVKGLRSSEAARQTLGIDVSGSDTEFSMENRGRWSWASRMTMQLVKVLLLDVTSVTGIPRQKLHQRAWVVDVEPAS
jgi:hypothetical protein